MINWIFCLLATQLFKPDKRKARCRTHCFSTNKLPGSISKLRHLHLPSALQLYFLTGSASISWAQQPASITSHLCLCHRSLDTLTVTLMWSVSRHMPDHLHPVMARSHFCHRIPLPVFSSSPYSSSMPTPSPTIHCSSSSPPLSPASQTLLIWRLQLSEAAISSPHHPPMLRLQEMMMYGLVRTVSI